MLDFDGNGAPSRQRRHRWRGGKTGNVLEQRKRGRSRKTVLRRRNIAILDFETDPFDAEREEWIFPFLVVLYSDQFEPIILWDEDWKALVSKIIAAIEALPDKFTIYAHNGGRFDYMFLIHELRGQVMFKGRAIMRATIGNHEIRDSLHIIPESLKNANDKKDIDYKTMFTKENRNKHREEIIAYCLSDCEFTFETVRAFVDRFGLPMTIGQAAMKELKKHYTFKRLGGNTDAYIRDYFHGGRVECIAPAGVYTGDLKLYDVHSMYPSVMAYVKHPIGDEFLVNDHVTKRTVFIHLRCRNNGAFVSIDEDGTLTARKERGEFRTTIHEYNMARELGVISDIDIIKTIDFSEWSNFSEFVVPLYTERQRLKEAVKLLPEGSPERKRMEQDIKFFKYLLNNCYGKFAQNPRRFKEFYITDPNETPPDKWLFRGVEFEHGDLSRIEPGITLDTVKMRRSLPDMENDLYWIWSHRCPEFRFNNVATAASITGAARAKLMEAIYHATNPLYCDTDSLVCSDIGALTITPSELGTWNLEKRISEIILTGKKQYAYRDERGKETIRSKGMKGVTWDDMLAIVRGATITKTMPAPTISKNQQQKYLTRQLRRTAA